MKTTKILTIQSVLLWVLMGFIPFAHTQDVLSQLNAEDNSDQNETALGRQDTVQGVVEDKTVVTTGAIDNDKLRASLSPGEFQQFAAAEAYVDQNSKYTLGPDDVIDIVVMRHPEVSGEYIINKEGKIQYEFVGDVELAGLTKEQAVDVLTKKLSVYIIHPEIGFKISGYNSKIVYVVGEVANPGRIPMHGDTITVREALLAAGLPLITAATNRSSLFTPSMGHVVIKRVNVEALLYKGDLREDYVMHPGDCLYVPATFLAKTMRAISPVTTPVGEVANTGGAAKYAF